MSPTSARGDSDGSFSRGHEGTVCDPATKADVADAAWVLRLTRVACCMGLGVLGLLFLPGLNARQRGFVGAFGAVVIFGSSSVPAKHPGAAAVGPFRFQIYVTVGNCAATLALGSAELLFLAASQKQRQGCLGVSAWGAVGALTLTATQCCAWPAIQRLGAAAGPGVWCGVGMATAFAWGRLAFGEAVASPALALAALACLAVGTGLVAASQSALPRTLADMAHGGGDRQGQCAARQRLGVAGDQRPASGQRGGGPASPPAAGAAVGRGRQAGRLCTEAAESERGSWEVAEKNTMNPLFIEEGCRESHGGGCSKGRWVDKRDGVSDGGDRVGPAGPVELAAVDVAGAGGVAGGKASSAVSTLSLAAGLGFAVATGLFDGSLMAAFQAFRESERRQPEETRTSCGGGGGGGDDGGEDLQPERQALAYLLSFGFALPLVALPPLILLVRRGRLRSRLLTPGGSDTRDFRGGESGGEAVGGVGGGGVGGSSGGGGDDWEGIFLGNNGAAPEGTRLCGLCCGALWAGGNFCGLRATLGLGQAIGFPLTQVCVLISAGWGIVGFGELPGAPERAAFALASALVLAGAFLLADQQVPASAT